MAAVTRTLLALALLVGCQSEAPKPAAAPGSAAPATVAAAPVTGAPVAAPAVPAAPVDWKAWIAAETACADCHPDEVAAWQASPMGRSLAALPPGAPLPPGMPAEVVHPVTGEHFRARNEAGRLEISEAVDGVEFARVSTFVVGSGAHTQSWFWQDGPDLYAQPLTWYSQAKRWDLSPGYAPAGHPGFFREITAECAWCHGALLPGGDDPVPAETVNRGIPCARCHGDPRPHIAARQAGKPGAITVPTQLPPDREAAVCEYCHLQGNVRLLAEGRQWTDFVPGMALADVVSIFDRQGPRAGVGIVSHAARLHESKCRAGDGERLTCTACHQPHATTHRDRSAACRDCHAPAEAKHCAGPGTEDCVACHMSRVGTADIPHVSITDHLIARKPTPLPPQASDPAAPLLQLGDAAQPDAQTGAPAALRRYGRAYAEAARTSNHPQDVASGYTLMRAGVDRALGEALPSEIWFDLASLELMRADWTAARASIEQAWKTGDRSDRVVAATASLRMREGDLKGAMEILAQAPPEADRHYPYLNNKAIILAAAGRPDEARAAADAAMKARPLDGEAWITRGNLAQILGDQAGAVEAFATATRRRPDDLRGWLDLGHAHLRLRAFVPAEKAFTEARKRSPDPTIGSSAAAGLTRAWVGQGRLDEAAALLPEVFKYQPAPDAYVALAALALAAGRLEEAMKAIDAAAPSLPDDAELWWIAGAVLEAKGMLKEAEMARGRATRLGYPAEKSAAPVTTTP